MNNPEIILNLWAIHDPDDNVIYGLAGRAYYTSGTDEEKLTLLKQLAVSDYVMALRVPVPERFSIESEGEIVQGLCNFNELNNPATTLFEDLYRELENEIMYRYTADSEGNAHSDTLKISVNPLYVITALVEDEQGVIRANSGD